MDPGNFSWQLHQQCFFRRSGRTLGNNSELNQSLDFSSLWLTILFLPPALESPASGLFRCLPSSTLATCCRLCSRPAVVVCSPLWSSPIVESARVFSFRFCAFISKIAYYLMDIYFHHRCLLCCEIVILYYPV